MKYRRMPIEIESPEQMGYGNIRCNLTESSVADMRLSELGIDLRSLVLAYTDHLGKPGLREIIAADGPGLSAQDVIVTPGAAAALFIVATSLLEVGRSPCGDAPELCHEHRDAARHRMRGRSSGPVVRAGIPLRDRSSGLPDETEHEDDQSDHSAQPDRDHPDGG